MKCDTCKEECPQSARAHQATLGRMYATQELVSLLKKIDEGKLVEVPDCNKCYYNGKITHCGQCEHCIGNTYRNNNFLRIIGRDCRGEY